MKNFSADLTKDHVQYISQNCDHKKKKGKICTFVAVFQWSAFHQKGNHIVVEMHIICMFKSGEEEPSVVTVF